MKGMFTQFDDIRNNNNKKVWEEALFVFDTNCLLNLYRYRTETRDQLINVIEKISGRIWIPHHVALEFQRNRLKVILSQKKRFSEIREVITNSQNKLQSEIGNLQLERRHSLIDPSPLINGFKELVERFFSDLDALQKSQQPISTHDPIKIKIEELFDGKVGNGPSEQKEVDDLYKLAEKRYQFKIPPGYLDSKKDKDEPDEHYHSGVLYKRKFGDFVIWNQLLTHAKENNLRSIIFVTDDGKEDWWWKINDEGPKTLGPRPELVDEAKHVGGITSFLMYKPEGFLENSRNFVDADVSKETIDEVGMFLDWQIFA
ncbi:PIN-like domain-containing protein [Paracoccus aerius]|uniref:PIN-like domain-containing protein n=1 Tax=Paracoccus aerius TaxID=1915382 RepID=UPI0036100F06